MEPRRWINQGLPQTLQIAVFLFYIHAAFGFLDLLRIGIPPLLGAGILGWIFILIVPGNVAAGYGIANEKKVGYFLGIGVALLPFALRMFLDTTGSIRVSLQGIGNLLNTDPINLLFEIALVALLFHPQSRDYQRIWFK